MELVTILRELWRGRYFVLVAALVAVLAATAVAYKLPSFESRKYEVGVATARILVDTPRSQVIEVAPKGSDMLGVRANLIANLMAEGVVKASIAERAGLAPADLDGVAESATSVAGDRGKPTAGSHVLTTRVLATADGDRLPIIEIEAQAPDAAAAQRLAGAAVEGLRDYLDTKAAGEQVSDAERLVVSGLGTPQARQDTRGPRLMLSALAALVVLGLGCLLVVAVPALARGWRAAAMLEQFELDDVADMDDQVTPLFTSDARPLEPAGAEPREHDRARRA